MRKYLTAILSALLLTAMLTGCSLMPGRTNEEPQTEEPESNFTVWFLDVGQADCALVECDGCAMLIDGGNVEDGDTVVAFLQDHNIDNLQYVTATHAHEDHVGGLSDVLQAIPTGTVVTTDGDYDSDVYDTFLQTAQDEGCSVNYVRAGDDFTLGSASISVLGPVNESDELNDMSIVLKIVYGETSFLFTGDAEENEEKDIIASLSDPNELACTVLKVGHHGSDSSSCYEFLYYTQPQYGIISVGANNSYGHPDENTLSRLRDADVTVYRTDECGNIQCVSDGETVTVIPDHIPSAETETAQPESTGTPEPDPTDTPDPDPTDTPEPEPTVTPESEADGEEGSAVLTDMPDDCTYVLNNNTMKFHNPDCASAVEMSAANRSYTTLSREELIEMGFEPCKRCNP